MGDRRAGYALILLLLATATAASAQTPIQMMRRNARAVAAATPERFSPDELVQQTELTGALSTIQDDPDTPDGNWMVTTAGGAAILRVGFPTPVTAPTVGANLQECRYWIRKNATGGSQLDWTIDVYESSSPVVVACASGTVSSTTGVIASCLWNANVLSLSSGAGVECHIRQTAGHTGTPSGRRYLEVGAVEWNEQ